MPVAMSVSVTMRPAWWFKPILRAAVFVRSERLAQWAVDNGFRMRIGQKGRWEHLDPHITVSFD